MTEQVDLQVEDMIPELEVMDKIGIFTKNEIRSIIKKRRLFEFKLQKFSKSKENILRYIMYEIEIMMIVKQKLQEKGLPQKKSNLEYCIANRINKLYSVAIRRFPRDCRIWLSYIKFCKQVKLYSCVSRLFDQILELHSDKPALFKIAARWEFHECHSIERARRIIHQGLLAHKDSKLLFIEAFKLELLYINQRLQQGRDKGEREENGLPADPVNEETLAGVIYTSAVKKINDVSFLVDLLNVMRKYNFTSSLQNKIIEEMRSKYPEEEVTWDTLARRELDLSGTPQEKIGKCISVYEDGLRNVPTEKMWSFYLDYILEINEDLTTLPTLKKKYLTNAFYAAHKENMLMEKYYLLWAKKVEDKDICKILQWGTERLGSRSKLWSWRLRYHLSKFDEAGAMAVFKEIIANPNIPDQASLWMLVLNCYQIVDTIKAESLWNEGVNNPIVGSVLKGRYIEWLATNRGIIAARKAYSTLSTTPPYSLDIHLAMSNLEDAQPQVSLKFARQVYDTAVNQFGKSNADVWLWYVKFEAKFGDPEQVLKIYDHALKTLDSHLIDGFISEYRLNEAGTMSNGRGMSNFNEVSWDNLARKKLELSGKLEERIGKCISVYENGLKNIPTRKMWSLYLDYILEINEDLTTLPNLKKNCLKNAFEAGHKENMLSEKHYLLWIKKVEDVDICKVLQWGTESLSSSRKLWSWRLRYHLSKYDEAGAMAVFKEIISNPNIPDQASLWMLVLKCYQIVDTVKAERLWMEGVNNPIVGAVLKGRYIEWLAMTNGIMAARRAYSALSTTPPYSLDIHVAMSKVEDAQPKISLKYARQVYETAVNQFGKSNTDVWLWYIKFEAKFGEPDLVPRIYDQAVKTLNSHLVDVFISEYHLNKAETMDDRGLSSKYPKEEVTWDTLARRELELNGTLEERIRTQEETDEDLVVINKKKLPLCLSSQEVPLSSQAEKFRKAPILEDGQERSSAHCETSHGTQSPPLL